MEKESIFKQAGNRFLDWFNGNKSDTQSNIPQKSATGNFNVQVGAWSLSYNGEKNLGEMGPPRNYLLDYDTLRIRSWQAYMESEVAQFVLNKFVTWIIGSGLRLQAQPNEVVLKTQKIELDTEEFNHITEALFEVFASSKDCSYNGMRCFQEIMKQAKKNAIIGGDVLVVLRYEETGVTVQLIDGAHVRYSGGGSDTFALRNPDTGNEIRHGVEMDARGKHVAYWVRTKDYKYERIPAVSDVTGLTTAFLVYGLEYRLDNTRGLPLISAVMETLKKMERYKEATLATAEEKAKNSYQVVHQQFSTGENPMVDRIAKANGFGTVDDDIPRDQAGREIATQVTATTNKQAFNMPIGAELKPMEHGNGELIFKDFFTTNIDLVCAALQIPPNVAMSKYDSNFSASRAALKDWELVINVNRIEFGRQFMQPVYEFWLHTEILLNRVQAPGYMMAFLKKNKLVTNAYRVARFTGPGVPHIDPVKEVTAQRLKLGNTGAHIPLTTVERATEELNGGDSMDNMQQYALELQRSIELNIVDVEPPAGDGGQQKTDPPAED